MAPSPKQREPTAVAHPTLKVFPAAPSGPPKSIKNSPHPAALPGVMGGFIRRMRVSHGCSGLAGSSFFFEVGLFFLVGNLRSIVLTRSELIFNLLLRAWPGKSEGKEDCDLHTDSRCNCRHHSGGIWGRTINVQFLRQEKRQATSAGTGLQTRVFRVRWRPTKRDHHES